MDFKRNERNMLIFSDNVVPCVCASAIISIAYTFAGGMYSVAYTDVLQLVLTFIGLYLTIPYMITSDKTDILSLPVSSWTGRYVFQRNKK